MYRVADIVRAVFLGIGRVNPDPDWRTAPSHHAFHELIVVMDGRMAVRSGSWRTDAGPGSVLIYPAGVDHEERSDRQTPLSSLFLCFRGLRMGNAPVIEVQDARGTMREIAARIYSDRDASSAAARAQRAAFLHAILAEFLRNMGTEDQPLVADVRRHVRAHIGEPLTLADLAGIRGLSKFHFLRQYKAATGRTPMADLRAIRSEYARELVMSTRLPLKEIALRAGLGDEYSLSRAFRRQFNVPPGQYRRRPSLPSRRVPASRV